MSGDDTQTKGSKRPLYVDFCEKCGADRVHWRRTGRCQTCQGKIRREGGTYLWQHDVSEYEITPFDGYDLQDVFPV